MGIQQRVLQRGCIFFSYYHDVTETQQSSMRLRDEAGKLWVSGHDSLAAESWLVQWSSFNKGFSSRTTDLFFYAPRVNNIYAHVCLPAFDVR